MKKTCILIFLIISFSGGVAYGYKADNDGFIRDWLVAGPFPKEGLWPICKGYSKDFLEVEGGEVNIAPYPKLSHRAVFIPSKMPPVQVQARQGEKLTLGWEIKETIIKDVLWSPFTFSFKGNRCNFKEIDYFMKEYVVSYAACYIEMKEDKKLKLKIGSDDGTKIWINHKFIGELHKHRSAKIDEDVYEVELKKGINLLLVKLEQDWAGWELILRFTGTDDTPFTDYEISLTGPDFAVVDKVTRPEKINILDRDVAGFLSWENTEGQVLFPGENKGTIKLSSFNSGNAKVMLSITDAKNQKVFSKEDNVTLGPNNEAGIAFSVNFPSSGMYNFNALVNSRENANLTKSIKVLSPIKLQEDYLKLKEKNEDLEQTVRENEEEIKNKQYIIDLKDSLMEKKYRESDALLKEVIKFREEAK